MTGETERSSNALPPRRHWFTRLRIHRPRGPATPSQRPICAVTRSAAARIRVRLSPPLLCRRMRAYLACVVRGAPSEVEAAVPLEPSTRVLAVDPPAGFPGLQRLARFGAVLVHRDIVRARRELSGKG